LRLLAKALRKEIKSGNHLEALKSFRRKCWAFGLTATAGLADLAVAPHSGLATYLFVVQSTGWMPVQRSSGHPPEFEVENEAMSITPQDLQKLLDEREPSRASRKRAWENLQEIRWVLKDIVGMDLPPVTLTFPLGVAVLDSGNAIMGNQ
jgi:hypothetical protein